MGDLGFHFQGHLGLKRPNFATLRLVNTIFVLPCNLEPPSLGKMCTVLTLPSHQKMGDLGFHFQGHLGLKRPNFATLRLVNTINF